MQKRGNGLLYERAGRRYAALRQDSQPPLSWEDKPMLRNRDEIREDKSFDQLTEAILQRDQPRIDGSVLSAWWRATAARSGTR